MNKIVKFTFTVDNHLDPHYCFPTQAQSRSLVIEFEDGEIIRSES